MAGPSPDPSLYRDRNVVPVRRALVSVSDKTDLLRLAEALAAAGVEIRYQDPARLDQTVKADLAYWSKVITAGRITVD